jgi:hypothetical protein
VDLKSIEMKIPEDSMFPRLKDDLVDQIKKSIQTEYNKLLQGTESLPVNRTKSRQHTKCLQVYPIG